MRSLLLTLACVLAGGTAMASSIQSIDSKAHHGGDSNIIEKSCVDCPPLVLKTAEKEYTVPTLTPGTQSVVIRTVDGEKKVVRTEAWMGGSPVMFISKPTPEALAAAGEPADGIDMTATTAALSQISTVPVSAPLDLSTFQLRQ